MSYRTYFLLISFGIDPDLHPLQNLQIFFSKIEARCVCTALIVARVRSQPDLEPERQFHFITRFSQALNRFGNLGRILYRLIDGGADFANYLFCVVIDFHSLLCYASQSQIANSQSAIRKRQ